MDKSNNDTSTTGTPINLNSLLQSSLCFLVTWKGKAEITVHAQNDSTS